MSPNRPIVIFGPTAGGKSALAVELAEHYAAAGVPSEIIGADSMQVYRHLDAGTAKPDQDLRARAPHHLIDIVEPTQRFTVHDWLSRARTVIDNLQAHGGVPIVVGGTNLYLKALLEGMFDGPGQDERFRAGLSEVQTTALHERLKRIDPETAQRVKPADRQRIVRALEVYELTGKSISKLQTQWAGERDEAIGDSPGAEAPSTSGLDAVLVGLRWSADAINPRINLRVKAMFYPDKVNRELAAAVCINGESLIDETQRLRESGLFDSPEAGSRSGAVPNQAREALGYKQLLAWIEGTDRRIQSLEDAFEQTKVLTRRFAKQQRTWLKRFTKMQWIECDTADPATIRGAAIGMVESDGSA